jgi:hypothetical protein
MLCSSLIAHPRKPSVKFQIMSASVDAEVDLPLQRRKSTAGIVTLETRFATRVLLTNTEIINSIHCEIYILQSLLIRYFLCFTEKLEPGGAYKI